MDIDLCTYMSEKRLKNESIYGHFANVKAHCVHRQHPCYRSRAAEGRHKKNKKKKTL